MPLLHYITVPSHRNNIREVYINSIQQQQSEVGGNLCIPYSTLGVLPNVLLKY